MFIHREMDTNVAHIYDVILLSHKKNKINAICETWMDLETVILKEFNSDTERKIS